MEGIGSEAPTAMEVSPSSAKKRGPACSNEKLKQLYFPQKLWEVLHTDNKSAKLIPHPRVSQCLHFQRNITVQVQQSTTGTGTTPTTPTSSTTATATISTATATTPTPTPTMAMTTSPNTNKQVPPYLIYIKNMEDLWKTYNEISGSDLKYLSFKSELCKHKFSRVKPRNEQKNLMKILNLSEGELWQQREEEWYSNEGSYIVKRKLPKKLQSQEKRKLPEESNPLNSSSSGSNSGSSSRSVTVSTTPIPSPSPRNSSTRSTNTLLNMSISSSIDSPTDFSALPTSIRSQTQSSKKHKRSKSSSSNSRRSSKESNPIELISTDSNSMLLTQIVTNVLTKSSSSSSTSNSNSTTTTTSGGTGTGTGSTGFPLLGGSAADSRVPTPTSLTPSSSHHALQVLGDLCASEASSQASNNNHSNSNSNSSNSTVMKEVLAAVVAMEDTSDEENSSD